MKSFEERLEAESAVWAADNLITVEQRSRLLALHPVRSGGSNRLLGILAAIGGAMLVVGVSLIIKSNWEELGDWVKMGGLLAVLVASYAVGWRLKISPGNSPRIGDAFLMVGAVCFLLGIALVSQVFHIDSRPANGVLLWWAGIAVLPWLTRAKGVQFVSLVAGLVWIGMEFHANDSWLRLAMPNSPWLDESRLFMGAEFLLGLVVLCAGVGMRTGWAEAFAGLHEKFGLVIMTAALYAQGFAWAKGSHHQTTLTAARWQPVLVLVVLVLVAASFAAVRNRSGIGRLAGYAALGLLPSLAQLFGVDFKDSGWMSGGLACIAMFLLNLGMIREGLATGRETWINLGMAGIALNIVTRYFLLFGTMLEGGVFFIVTGALILGLGFGLERKRRALVGSVRGEVRL